MWIQLGENPTYCQSGDRLDVPLCRKFPGRNIYGCRIGRPIDSSLVAGNKPMDEGNGVMATNTTQYRGPK